ncbi:hypothetical protein RJ640_030681 [Escallonia rubra]|uniref:Uncharacterized protein n=1 Tax=Escallonia rubra TaxID=112253 RepID=A0AA88RXG8_9ASTE|nr:hypothetical protein RJ640_030681 [Escallonia rubra]
MFGRYAVKYARCTVLEPSFLEAALQILKGDSPGLSDVKGDKSYSPWEVNINESFSSTQCIPFVGMGTSMLKLQLMVYVKAHKVIFVEAEKDFVDVLFHILALPIEEFINLFISESTDGCIGNLYKRIENMNDA